MAWHRVAALEALTDGGVDKAEIASTPVALFRNGDLVHATHGICTHALAFLADGWVEDGKVECPLHQGLFDIRTGRALCAPLTEDLRTYAVKVEAGEVFVDLERPADTAAPSLQEMVATASPARSERVVVVGAGQAAAAAIRALRVAGFDGEVTLIGQEAHLPYERPALSKEVLASPDASPPCRLTEADARDLGVTLRLGTRVEGVDPAARQVILGDGKTLAYDKLLIATGGDARRLSVPGADHPGVLHLRTLEDAQAIAASLGRSRRVAVIGGGFIGLELASAARARGCEVMLIEREAELMARLLPPPLGAAFRTLAASHGVTIRLGEGVDSIEEDGQGLLVRTTKGSVHADVVLVGVGLQVASTIGEAAGCAMGAGAIVVDAEGRTSVPGIWAAGDCVTLDERVHGRRVRLESWQNAEEGGAAAGRSMAGAPGEAPKRPWFWTDQFGLNIQMIGLPGPEDRVALSGSGAEAGAIYRTVDRATGRLTGVVAFGSPAAIREARGAFTRNQAFDPAEHGARWLGEEAAPSSLETDMMDGMGDIAMRQRFAWPAEGLTAIPDWVYTDETIYKREVERIFHGRTWNYVALEAEIPKVGDFIRSNVGPTPVVVSRAEDGSISVFENRCTHRAAEFCREMDGNVKEFVCPYHQWTYDLKGNLAGVPFRRGVNGQGGMPADFDVSKHGLRQLNVTTHRGVVFASYAKDMESFPEYLGPEVLREFEATFDGRKMTILGHYRHTLPGNWKLYHENLKDPYHATLLHTFLVTFGLLVAGNKSLMLADETGRHGVMASAKSDASKLSADSKKEMRAYREGMTLQEPRFMDFVDEFDSPWSVTMATIWPNLIVQREMNTLGIRQIVPTGPNEFIMKWTMFGFEGDSEEMTRHRLRQGNLMGPAGFLGLEDNEAIKFVQDGMKSVPGGTHVVKLDPAVEAGTSDTLISESAIRAMYRHWRQEMGL
jgi:anthranilate 1,2-dioxygenase large subunit